MNLKVKTFLFILSALLLTDCRSKPTAFRYARSEPLALGYSVKPVDQKKYPGLWDAQFMGNPQTSTKNAVAYAFLAAFLHCQRTSSSMFLVRGPERFEFAYRPEDLQAIDMDFKGGFSIQDIENFPVSEGVQKVGVRFYCFKRFLTPVGLKKISDEIPGHVIVKEVDGPSSKLRVNDVIESIDAKPVHSALEFLSLSKQWLEEEVEIKVLRGKESLTIQNRMFDQTEDLRKSGQSTLNAICKMIPEGADNPCRSKPSDL